MSDGGITGSNREEGDASPTANVATTNNGEEGGARRERLTKRPKRKVAIIFGYIGERYCGLQWNRQPEYPTIEAELLRALHSTGMISTENYEQEKVQQKVNWERASRTDKGVHALRNVISLNIMLPFAKDSTTEYDTEEARRLLMEVLPHDIIVYRIVFVTGGFNAYSLCGARKYEYYLPTFALMTPDEYCQKYFACPSLPSRPTVGDVDLPGATPAGSGAEETTMRRRPSPGTKRPREEALGEALDKDDEGSGATKTKENDPSDDPKREEEEKHLNDDSESNVTAQKSRVNSFRRQLMLCPIPEDVMRRVAQYRLSPERLEHTRNIFRLYEGTHSYHNFTLSRRPSDPSCKRYIMSVTVGDPFVVEPTDVDVMTALQRWAPSRCYSPDDELLAPMQPRDMMDAEEHRKRMWEHMVRVYGDTCGDGRNNGDSSGGKGGVEMVRIEIHGQSFMLNQIRKMVGAAVAICVAGLSPEYLRTHWMNPSVHCGVPTVPANGLFLTYLDFQRYNYRLERIQSLGDNGTGKGGVDVNHVDEDTVTEFRRKILAVILRKEMAEDIMGRWMQSLRQLLRCVCSIELP